ncbi:MAG: PLP-dependent aminotransferase family protein [Betaproteobacteria bacterium]
MERRLLKPSQSTIGLFRAIGVEPAAVPRTRPMYRRLVETLEHAIARGSLAQGFRLPPERELAAALAVGRATVVRAFRELEARGLVRGYVGRGTFVSARPDAAAAPFAWRGKMSAAALGSVDSTVRDLVRHAADPRLVSLAAGEPALDHFPTDAFRDAVTRVLARQARAAWGHGPTEGLGRFREAIADRFGAAPVNVMAIAGAQQGLDLLARCLIDRGDAVIVDRPGYLGAIQTFRTAGARLVGWDVAVADLDELEESLLRYRPKLIYTNPTFQNPTGGTLPIRLRRELLELAERYRVPIVEDDTYRELTLGADPPPSLYELDGDGSLVIRVNSFSKMLAPGLRLGWISAARPIVDQLALIKQQVDPHTQNLSQLVVAELIEEGVLDRHLVALRAEHRRRRDAMVKALHRHVASESMRFAIPPGGLYLWCRLGGGARAGVVQRQALADSVLVLTGEPFYVDGGGAQELRICFTTQPPERADAAARVLGRAVAGAGRTATDGETLVRVV